MSTLMRPAMIRVLADHYGVPVSEVVQVWNAPVHPHGLRDDFAKAALTGHLSAGRLCGTPNAVAIWCYQIADAMLVERIK